MRRTARRIARPSIEERKAEAIKERAAERVRFVRTLLQSHADMKASGRMALSELEWVRFRLGCSSAEGEKLIALAMAGEDEAL